jgi:hypothetical protein
METDMSNTLEVTLDGYVLGSAPARRAASECFGLCQDTMNRAYRTDRPITALVTYAQFGKFIALRNIYGGCNSIKALKPTPICNPLHLRVDCTEYRTAA